MSLKRKSPSAPQLGLRGNMKILNQQEYKDYRQKLKDEGYPAIESTVILPQLCDCGSGFYKDRIYCGKEGCISCSYQDEEK